jgi:hypothetical protein
MISKMNTATKQVIKIGRQSAHSTFDFVEVFGGELGIDNKVRGVENKDEMIVKMANVIMELTTRGKFNLRNF